MFFLGSTPIISEADTISLPYPRLVGPSPFAFRGPRAMLVPAFTVSSTLVNFEDSLRQVACEKAVVWSDLAI